ncbi:flavodoxin family protein [Lacrimispora amygdalina]|uniref:flavodoxin family protein n=1 Tax=Lacrimispora amygdalina TaxID=253257 RepID=UPI0031F9647A
MVEMDKNKKSVIVLVGSRAEKNSNTGKLCVAFLDVLKKSAYSQGSLIQSEILYPSDWNIMPCRSCGTCFRKGFCPLDQKDGMAMLKNKIRKSDGIIFASPVYAAAVSGDMKILVDRLAGWLHTMPLIGKTAGVFSTADSNNGDAVTSYLNKMVGLMGASIVISQNVFIHFGTLLLKDDELLNSVLKEGAVKFWEGMGGKLEYNLEQEEYFHIQNLRFHKLLEIEQQYPGLSFGEKRIWEEQGYFKYNSLQEVIREKNI